MRFFSVISIIWLLLPSSSLGSGLQKGLEAYQIGSVAFEKGDYKTALKEWTPLAEQGNEYVQHTLGEMYFNGIGVLYDSKVAAKWYRLAAEQGFAPAQFKLSKLYSSGMGVILSPELAHMWANIATSNGDKDGRKFMDYLAKGMSENQLEKALDLARECVGKNYIGC